VYTRGTHRLEQGRSGRAWTNGVGLWLGQDLWSNLERKTDAWLLLDPGNSQTWARTKCPCFVEVWYVSLLMVLAGTSGGESLQGGAITCSNSGEVGIGSGRADGVLAGTLRLAPISLSALNPLDLLRPGATR